MAAEELEGTGGVTPWEWADTTKQPHTLASMLATLESPYRAWRRRRRKRSKATCEGVMASPVAVARDSSYHSRLRPWAPDHGSGSP